MCFLALMYKVVPEFSVVVAANRDEYLERSGLPPMALAPGIWGPKDPQAGGRGWG